MKSNKRDKTIENKPPKKKWVKKANMWVTIEIKDGKQVLTWSQEEPKL